MAIWNFQFYLLPNSSIVDKLGAVPAQLEEYIPRKREDTLDMDKAFYNYWSNSEELNEISRYVSNEFPELESWSEDARMYGVKDLIKLEIWTDEIVCSVHASSPRTSEIIAWFTQLALQFDCLFVLKENGNIVSANHEALQKTFNTSLACKYVKNPEKCLRELKREMSG